ncbi:MAG: hypothetical protein AAGL98_15580, partial [Planctomycetota bacterium]
METNTNSVVTGLGESSGGGLFASSDSSSASNLSYGSRINSNGDLEAAGDVTVRNSANNNVTSEANSDGGGLGASTDVDAEANIGVAQGFIGADIILGTSSDIVGDRVVIVSDVVRNRADARSDTTAGGLGGSATAESRTNINNASEVIIQGGGTGNGAQITGNDSILIQARFSETVNRSDADAALFAFAGSSNVRSTVDLRADTKVEGFWEAVLTTARLDVDVLVENVNHRATGNAHGIFIGPQRDGGNRIDTRTADLSRDIFWESHVILKGAADPILVVNEDRVIEQIENVDILGITGEDVGTVLGGTNIVLGDIVYDDIGSAEFFANDP